MSRLKPIAGALLLTLFLSPFGAIPAQAGHRHHYHDDNLSAGEAIAALVLGGVLVAAAMHANSHEYVGAPWGVIDDPSATLHQKHR